MEQSSGIFGVNKDGLDAPGYFFLLHDNIKLIYVYSDAIYKTKKCICFVNHWFYCIHKNSWRLDWPFYGLTEYTVGQIKKKHIKLKFFVLCRH